MSTNAGRGPIAASNTGTGGAPGGVRNVDDICFGQQLRTLRTERGMSQVELAAIVETNPCHVSDWERGKTEPKVPTIRRLALALEVPSWRLLEEET
jgi:ribosome-binding protein aMBF1 (putative translation factor)